MRREVVGRSWSGKSGGESGKRSLGRREGVSVRGSGGKRSVFQRVGGDGESGKRSVMGSSIGK